MDKDFLDEAIEESEKVDPEFAAKIKNAIENRAKRGHEALEMYNRSVDHIIAAYEQTANDVMQSSIYRERLSFYEGFIFAMFVAYAQITWLGFTWGGVLLGNSIAHVLLYWYTRHKYRKIWGRDEDQA